MGYGRTVWSEISLSAFRKNLQQIKTLLPHGTRFCSVLKADGYGHGALATGLEAVKSGVDYIAVAVLSEAISLRKAGFTVPILILGYTPADLAPLVVGNHISQTVYTLEQAQALSAAAQNQGRAVVVHVKVDTGMTRIGVMPEEAADFCAAVRALPGVVLEGIFTHFAEADSVDKDHANQQFELFKRALAAIAAAGLQIPLKHAANSAAILDMPETHLDMVRPGVIQYGLWPSDEVIQSITLTPVMQFKARLCMLKKVPAGVRIGYGGTFSTTRESLIATLPVGYADGYARKLTGKGCIFVNGHKAPLVGRVCMDQCMADVTGVPGIQEGSEALLFGGANLPVEEIAAQLGTINYEVVCTVGKRVPRVHTL